MGDTRRQRQIMHAQPKRVSVVSILRNPDERISQIGADPDEEIRGEISCS